MYMTSQSIEQLLYYLVGAKPLLTIHLFTELLNAIIISTIGNIEGFYLFHRVAIGRV